LFNENYETVISTYVRYSKTTTETIEELERIEDKFYNANAIRITLRCFGTDEQSIILRTL
jgi:hypothetical protein